MSSRLIEAVEKDIYQEVDGYYVFGILGSCLYAHHLREIADELDRRNKDWDDEITKYCEEHNG